MFTVTHFRSEFIHQGQATILRKVTMTQFMFIIILTALTVGLFGAPFWLAPLFIVLGYAAGYSYHGEIVLKRISAYCIVRLRSFTGQPRIINIQAEWDSIRTQAERQQTAGVMATTLRRNEPARSDIY